jgi:hypothetical protein
MKVTIYQCSTNSTLKAVIQSGYHSNLPTDVCNGEWILEVDLELQTNDLNLIIGLNPNQVINDINRQGYHVGHYGLKSTGFK